MLIALIIAALSVTIIHISQDNKLFAENKKLKSISILAIILLLIQIVLGTQVREQIDHISARLKFYSKGDLDKQTELYFLYTQNIFNSDCRCLCVSFFAIQKISYASNKLMAYTSFVFY